MAAASHTVIWKNPRAPITPGNNPLLGWSKYEWWSREQVFKRTGHPGPLASLASSALDGAIAATRNVTIAQVEDNPEKASPGNLLMSFMRVRPATLVCPERGARPGATLRWAMTWLTGDVRKAQPQTLPETAIQAAVNALAKEQFPPFNQAPSLYTVPSIVLRHDVTAEDLGIVEKQKVTPDMILAMVADDADVREAGARWDRATPATYLPLILARCAAQDRLGIPEAQQALLYSSEIEDYLTPVVMKLATNDERGVELRGKFRRLYGPVWAERVLNFCLANYPHGPIDGLKQAAGIAA